MSELTHKRVCFDWTNGNDHSSLMSGLYQDTEINVYTSGDGSLGKKSENQM